MDILYLKLLQDASFIPVYLYAILIIITDFIPIVNFYYTWDNFIFFNIKMNFTDLSIHDGHFLDKTLMKRFEISEIGN